ncbi:MAG TPA: L-threonylcarbamoyladenylate synthase [Longimicrobiales bacterium]|nr:L-threonylcarbamoyladenylate synthase [Longimicrobiales bacterium]
MPANTIRVDPTAPDPAAIAEAAEVIRAGGIVAFPTETVYGLGADALNPAAVQRIFDAKGRPSFNPIIVHVPDAAAARAVVADWPEAADRAAAAFWPGPLTLVLRKRPEVPDSVTAGLPTVAVRVPAHPVALALLRAAGVPVAAPSANRFTRISPTTAGHVARGLGDAVDLILDGGATPYGIESTVIDLTTDPATVLRPGVIGVHELEPVLGPITEAPDPEAAAPESEAPRPSPGMTVRHYSPDAELVVYADPETARAAGARAREAGSRIGAVVIRRAPPDADEIVALPTDSQGYARLFYAALHTLDEAGCGLVLVEQVPDTPAWAGVRDRLERAAAGSA